MKSGEYKKIWRYFALSDYKKEEQLINEMSAEGWNFVRTNGFVMTFRRGTPGQYIYKLDMPEKNNFGEVDEGYFLFLSDCGIRVIHQFKEWIYLRKEASSGPFESDLYSDLRMTNKVLCNAINIVCTMLIVFAAIIGVSAIIGGLAHIEFLRGVSMGAGIGAVFGLAFAFIPILRKLSKKMYKLVNEIGVRR